MLFEVIGWTKFQSKNNDEILKIYRYLCYTHTFYIKFKSFFFEIEPIKTPGLHANRKSN